MNYNVNVKIIPQRQAACVRMILPRYEDEGLAWQTLLSETDSQHLIPDNPCLCCAVFLDGEYKESRVAVEADSLLPASGDDHRPLKKPCVSTRCPPLPWPAAFSGADTIR